MLKDCNIPNEGVDTDNIDVVKSLDSIGDLDLVSTRVNDESEGVVRLNLLHRTVGEDRSLDNGEAVQGVGLGNRTKSITGLTRETESVGAVEVRGSANLLGDGTDTLLNSLCSLVGLGNGVLLVNLLDSSLLIYNGVIIDHNEKITW